MVEDVRFRVVVAVDCEEGDGRLSDGGATNRGREILALFGAALDGVGDEVLVVVVAAAVVFMIGC